ncbi:GNAT family N-acetyltransferase [Gramella lutea]|uniref:GNAT family N-acetyltransferase n=1 Tax=Christiangramia lutea TaxID=1607951 RepID=A0A9X2AA67_9FLAO|nr:GNAT family N-acetyltransferase [Christiangramia lutea]MCH4824394.1 GNAT family N-acetyltransferase [Christiangramia lutea]
MRFQQENILSLEQKKEILDLWNNEYPLNLNYQDISQLEDYLEKLKDQHHLLLLDENDKIKGWYSDFIREGERWFLAILDHKFQGRKFGRKMLEMAMESNCVLNGWIIPNDDYLKSNGEFYKSPIGFYQKIGFQILENIKLETEKIRAVKIQWRDS